MRKYGLGLICVGPYNTQWILPNKKIVDFTKKNPNESLKLKKKKKKKSNTRVYFVCWWTNTKFFFKLESTRICFIVKSTFIVHSWELPISEIGRYSRFQI